MTIKELHDLQGKSLSFKVAHTIDVISTFTARVGGLNHVYISFSGGVDSLVLLHIARKFVSPSFKAMFINTSMEWPEVVKFVATFDNVDIVRPRKTPKSIFENRGFPLVSKRVSSYIREVRRTSSPKIYNLRMGTNKFYSIPEKWRFLVNAPFDTSEECCRYIKKEPAHRYEKETGRRPLLGIMASESLLRQITYVKNGGCSTFAEGKEKSNPLSIWTTADVWEYIKHNNIKYCSIYDDLTDKRTGCVCCGYGTTLDPYKFNVLFRHYPKIYKYYLNIKNNGITYREALKNIGAILPDEQQTI